MKDTSIDSDGPEEYNSASEECDDEIVDETALSSPAQSDQNNWEAESGSQFRQAAGMVQKIQNQSQDPHHHQGNVVRSPMKIFGVSKTRIQDTRRIVLLYPSS